MCFNVCILLKIAVFINEKHFLRSELDDYGCSNTDSNDDYIDDEVGIILLCWHS